MNAHSMTDVAAVALYDSEERVAMAELLYRQGLRVEVIAAQMGLTMPGLRGLMSRNAHRFAARSERMRERLKQPVLALAELRGLNELGRQAGASEDSLTELFGAFAAGREIPRLPGEAVTMMELKSSHCRWPVGPVRGAETLFCGKQRALRSYCTEHAKAAGMMAEIIPTGRTGR